MNLAIDKRIIYGYIAISVLLIGLIINTYIALRNYSNAIAWVIHTNEVNYKLEGVLSLLKDVETGQRGFIITRDEKFLEPYYASVGQVNTNLKDLRRMTADNPVQQRWLNQLEPLVLTKITFTQQTIDQARINQEAAIQAISTERGKRLMDEIRRVIVRNMQIEELRLLNERNQRANRQLAMANLFLLLGALLITALLIWGLYAINKEMKRRIQVEEKLNELNRNLEIKVDERTLQLAHQNEELKHAKEIAEIANRNKTDILNVVTHELRTPLNSIVGFSQMLESGVAGELNKKQLRYSHNIHKSGVHLSQIIDGVLNVIEMERVQPEFHLEDTEPESIIQQLYQSFKAEADRKGVSLSYRITDQVTTIRTDPKWFTEILRQLISNAIRFSDENQTIYTSLGKEDRNGHWIIGSVQDRGRGIPRYKLVNIFKPLASLDTSLSRQQQGLNMGLSLTKRLVELLGGEITAESIEGIGSTFTFRLPVHESTNS